MLLGDASPKQIPLAAIAKRSGSSRVLTFPSAGATNPRSLRSPDSSRVRPWLRHRHSTSRASLMAPLAVCNYCCPLNALPLRHYDDVNNTG